MTEVAGAPRDLRLHTCEIVSAYVSNNHVARSELPALIATIQSALGALTSSGETAAKEPKEKPTSAQVRRSITPDALISFIDGKPYKTLKRHLTAHGFSPDSYRTQFGLPSDYPLVTASYSEQRVSLARSIGLGKTIARRANSGPSPSMKKGRQKAS